MGIDSGCTELTYRTSTELLPKSFTIHPSSKIWVYYCAASNSDILEDHVTTTESGLTIPTSEIYLAKSRSYTSSTLLPIDRMAQSS